MNELIELLVDFLPTTKEGAVNQSDISDHLGISRRNVRQLVQQARREGYPICSTPYNGYWYSSDPEDLQETIAILNASVMTTMDTISDLRRLM
jgi:biotin operon repressor